MTDILSQQKPQSSTVVSTPSTQAFGDAAATGTATDYARGDHKHAVPVAQAYNAITNPACNFFQVGNSGAAAADGTVWADNWVWFKAGGGAVQHAAFPQNSPISGGISPNFVSDILQMNTTTADTSIGAAEYYMLRQGIEGYNVHSLANGMALSFYMYAVKAGVYSVSLATRAGAQTYVMEANIAANTWTYFAFPNIAAPPAWEGDMKAQVGLYLRFMMAAGSDYQTSTINAWNTAGKFVSSNQVNGVDAINNGVYLYGWNLVPGPIALPYRPQDYQAELARVLRYRQVIAAGSGGPRFNAGYCYSTTQGFVVHNLKAPMVGTPTLALSAASHFSVLTAAGAANALSALADDGTSNNLSLSLLFTAGTANLAGGNATMLYASNALASLVASAYPG